MSPKSLPPLKSRRDEWAADLLDHYGPTMGLRDLAEVLKLKLSAIHDTLGRGEFPIATFKIGRRRIARTVDVAAYLANCEEGC